MSNDEPEHHRRYMVAWLAYRDPDTPKHCLMELEREMDSAQNHFNWEEFQKFKKTLPGFCEYWEDLKEDLVDGVRKILEDRM